MALTVSSHPDAQYAGAALMLTLSTMSRSMVDRMVTSGAVEQLASLMFDEGETQAVQSVAAKTILTIAKKCKNIILEGGTRL